MPMSSHTVPYFGVRTLRGVQTERVSGRAIGVTKLDGPKSGSSHVMLNGSLDQEGYIRLELGLL